MLPLLDDLPTTQSTHLVSVSNNQFGLLYQNVGVIKKASMGEVTIYKYIEGTAIDKDGDNKLSDEEKATGTPLAGASFEVYSADDDKKVAEGTTKEDGFLSFTELPYGDYYLVETKSPSGYELLKAKLPFTISAKSATVKLYIGNAKASILPFTGVNTPVIFATLIALIGLICGIGYFVMKMRINSVYVAVDQRQSHSSKKKPNDSRQKRHRSDRKKQTMAHKEQSHIKSNHDARTKKRKTFKRFDGE